MAGGFNKLFYSKDIFTQNAEDNRIVTFASAKVLSGSSNLTFDGSNLVLTGNIYLSGDITSSGGGLVTGAANVGGGAGVFYQKSGGELQFNSLAAGTNITINSRDDNTIEISSSGGGGGGGAVNNFNNATNNYIITAVDTDTISGEANLQFDGSALTLVGVISGSSDAVFVGDVTSEGSLNVTGTITGSTLTSTFLTSSYISGAFIYGDGSNITGLTGTPGGSDTQIQFNDGGSFGGDGGLTYNKTTNTLSGEIISGSGIGTFVGGLVTEGNVSVSGAVSGASTLAGLGITGTSLELQSGGITAAGSIAGATTYSGSSTITAVGAISGSGALSSEGAITTAGGLVLQGSGITSAGAIAGATTVTATSTVSGAAIQGTAGTLTSLSLQSGGITNAGIISGSVLTTTFITGSHISGALFYGDGSNLTGVTTETGGSDTEVQFNDGGSLGGDSAFTFNKTTNTLSSQIISGSGIGTFVGGLITEGDLNVTGTITGSNITATFVTGSNIRANFFIGDGSGLTGLSSAAISSYTQSGNDRLITSVDASSVQGEANLTFDGSTLAVAGAISGSSTLEVVGGVALGSTLRVSGAVSGASTLSGLGITGTSLEIQGGDITNAGTISGSSLTSAFITGSHVSGAIFYGDGSNLTGITGGSGSPGGSDTQIQFNDGGSFEGEAALTYTKGTDTLSGTIITSAFITGSRVSGTFFYGDGSNLTGVATGSAGGVTSSLQFNQGNRLEGLETFTYTVSSTENRITLTSETDAILDLQADTNNAAGAEDRNVYISLKQDAATVSSLIGHVGEAGYSPDASENYTGSLANSLLLGTTFTGTNSMLQLGTSNNVRMTIDSYGRVGINKTNPEAILHVTGTTSVSDDYGAIFEDLVQFKKGLAGTGGELVAYETFVITGSADNEKVTITNDQISGSKGILGAVTASSYVSGTTFYGDGSNLTGIGAASVGGSDTQVQFNDGGAFGGDSTFTFNKTTNTLAGQIISGSGIGTFVGGIVTEGNLNVTGAVSGASTLSGLGITGTSLELQSGGITNGGAISGTTFGGTATTLTSLALQSGGITNAGAIGGVTTLSASSNISASSFYAENTIVSSNDTDTYIDFTNDDRIDFYAGGERLLKIEETAQDSVVVGDGGDVDFRVATQGYGYNFFVRSATAGAGTDNAVGIRVSDPYAVLHVSGTTESLFRVDGDAGNGILFVTASGRVGIGTDDPDYALDVAGDAGFNEYIYHNGDTDTYIRFQGDQINIVAGAAQMIYINEGGAGVQADKVTINNDSTDIDFQVKGTDWDNLLRTDAVEGRVGIGLQGGSLPTHTLTVAGAISGSSTLEVVGAVQLGSTLNVTGALSGASSLSGLGITGTSLEIQGGDITNAGTISGSTLTTVFITGSHVSGALFYGDGSNLTGVAGTVAGSDTEVQFNDGGSLGADSGLIFNKTTNLLTAGSLTAGTVTSTGEMSGSGLATFMGGVVAGGTLEVSGATTLGGDVLPKADVGASIGSPTYRWANVYTGDLHLKNERGDWTIYEEADRLIVMNNLTGIRYKMMLEKIIEK